ncbi:hypothetical protein C1E24_00190 [Pseudoalteromonas phenolica]|uniref:Uncharacterized protein n=1 Tax=Pseudoalteromonas phenolica TaxID=161398 RepID=A0A5R9Q742_9GAMM|nr:ABC transporter permease [Pseudoalteromonas phenolica]TLX48963.1 hypothetical protein C1E24_00190 [Pseudoalteromonas phenolica]
MSIYQRALKHGVQRLITKPRLALPVLITLSLTLAAVLTVVAMSSNLIFKPLPDIKDEQNIYHVDRQVQVSEDFKISIFNRHGAAEFAEYYKQFGEVATLHARANFVQVNDQNLAITKLTASNNFQTVIANTPLLVGEMPSLSNQEGAVWISESLWRNAFASSANVVGRQLELEGNQLLIRGVFADFRSFYSMDDIVSQQTWQFFDLASHLADTPSNQFGGSNKLFIKTQNQVFTEEMLTQFWQHLFAKYETELASYKGMLEQMGTSSKVELYRAHLMKDQNTLIVFLFISVSALLFMASLNLFNLFLSHYQQREQEFATHLCLGSPRKRLFIIAFLESLPLFLFSALIGLFACAWLIRALPIISGGNIEMLSLVNLDLVTVSMAIFIVLIINAVFSLSAIFQCDSTALNQHINTSNKGVNAGKMSPLTKALFIAQLSSAALIMTGTALLAEATYNKVNVDLGFTPGNTMMVKVDFEGQGDPLPSEEQLRRAEEQRLHLEILDIKAQLSSAAQNVQPQLKILDSQSEPFGSNMMISMNFDEDTNEQITYMYKNIGADYVDAFGLKLLAGRNITAEEQTSLAQVAIINEPLALQLSQDGTIESAIGKQIGTLQIIGVIADHFSLVSKGLGYPTLMAPIINTANTGVYIMMQLPEGHTFKQSELKTAMLSAHPKVKQLHFDSLASIWDKHIEQDRIRFYFISGLCVLTLLLAFVGSNAMAVGFSELKRFELAIRMATGATRVSLLKRTLQSITPLLLIAAGIAIALSSISYGVVQQNHSSLPALSWTALGLFGFALLAIVLSAITWVVWRIINADPMRALREL